MSMSWLPLLGTDIPSDENAHRRVGTRPRLSSAKWEGMTSRGESTSDFLAPGFLVFPSSIFDAGGNDLNPSVRYIRVHTLSLLSKGISRKFRH